MLEVGQALYGESNKGHKLLSASPLAVIAGEVVNQMDIQGTIPPGVSWNPYWSGFAHKQWYIVAYTAPDPTAARQGMVRSRALFIPLKDAVLLDDIGSAFAALQSPLEEEIGDVILGDINTPVSASPGLVGALLSQGVGPVVWTQVEGFEAAVRSLWSNLWPEARAELSFRLAFSPQDVVNRSPTIVTTLPELASRWAEFRVIKGLPNEVDAAAAILLGEPSGASLRELIAAINAKLPQISDVRLALEIADALAHPGNLTDSLAALRLICHLSPEPSNGEAQKAALLQHTVECFKDLNIGQVRMARNLDLSAIKNNAGFWDALQEWASYKFFTTDNADDIAKTLLEAIDSDGPIVVWRTAISGGFNTMLRSTTAASVKLLWPVFLALPKLLIEAFSRVPEPYSLELALSDAVPDKMPPDTGEALIHAARTQNLIQIHAACCSARMAPANAVTRHMKEVAFSKTSLERTLRYASGAEMVTIALAHDNDTLFDKAAAACAADVSLLKDIDVRDAGWRRLWTDTLALNPAAWCGPVEPVRSIAIVLDNLLDGVWGEYGLLASIATSPLANLAAYPRRPELWAALPPQSLAQYLSATADGWIADFVSIPHEQAPEQKLADRIARPERLAPLLQSLTKNPNAGCLIFRMIPALTEQDFMQWIAKVISMAPQIDVTEAESIGRVTASRNWTQTANRIADIALEGRDDLRPALSYCVELVGYVRQYHLNMFLGSASESAKWRTLEELATELYGWGPGAQELWQRAGGKEKDIPNTSTGGEAWRKVIGDAERGGRKVDIRSLIRQMVSDYPKNRTLQKMLHDSFYR